MKHVILYTDGACRGNPGKGGWGAVLSYGKVQKSFYGYVPHTTNNQMELTAVIRGLGQLKERCHVTLYTDSKYVMDGVQLWLPDWKKRVWKTSTNKPLKNKELWQQLDALTEAHTIDWKWVKGHSGHDGNELADALANHAIDEQRETK